LENLRKEEIITLFLLTVLCFFGWRASSIFALTVNAVSIVEDATAQCCKLDVYELIGKNVRAGTAKPMGRLSFPKLSFYNKLL
jgi:hypothetical protein